MKVVCSGTVTAQIGLGRQKDRIATCLYFHHAGGRMMGAIFVTTAEISLTTRAG
jgi:hypothetical protein